MKTLKELIVEKKCRKGESAGATKRGAFWMPCEPITTLRAGGDGIGNSSADITVTLEFRHFRDGTVAAILRHHSWHQNYSSKDVIEGVASVLECTTAEQVICLLKGTSISDESGWCSHSIGSHRENDVVHALVSLGLAEREPAPDEVTE